MTTVIDGQLVGCRGTAVLPNTEDDTTDARPIKQFLRRPCLLLTKKRTKFWTISSSYFVRIRPDVIECLNSSWVSRVCLIKKKVAAIVKKCATGSATGHELNARQRVRMGQWNVRGLNSLGKLSTLSSELEKLDISICGLSETKWSGAGHFTTLDGHTVTFSGKTTHEYHGVAMWVHKTAAVSSRVISATFAAKPTDKTVVQCYASTADKPEEEIEQFYKEVEYVLAETPKRNLVFITGDFNARVRKCNRE